MGKYLKLYEKWIEAGKMDSEGLCATFGGDRLFDRITPKTIEEFPFYTDPRSIRWAYWGFDGESSGWKGDFIFSELRQNIVLFMAAMNGEL